MSRLLFIIVLLCALLIGTNPSRSDFNSWAQNYVTQKIEEDARKRGQSPYDGSSQIGGTIAGFVISNMPIDRRNYLLFSVYSFRVPEHSESKQCTILGIAGQFLPLSKCGEF